jgi:hypothetical protein
MQSHTALRIENCGENGRIKIKREWKKTYTLGESFVKSG